MIRVLIADDHVVVRTGLQQYLDTTDDIDVVGSVGDGAAAIDAVGELQPDVVVMDLSMPVLDGVEATRAINQRYPDCRVLVLTSFSEQSRILDALAAGADGYLLKHEEPDQIAAGIRSVNDGQAPLDPKAARVLLESRRSAPQSDATLTGREREVLELVAAGHANKQIARKLGISERTVKAHLTRVYSALGVTDRTQAALWAAQHLQLGATD